MTVGFLPVRFRKPCPSRAHVPRHVLYQHGNGVASLSNVSASCASVTCAIAFSVIALYWRNRANESSRYDVVNFSAIALHSELEFRRIQAFPAYAVDQQQELLAHDRDIRELIGARDLYVAEVYDVARNGATQKPYGRVFYTKGKSLIFYAYDLDQQTIAKNTSTFQVWGRRGPDREQAFPLGIFYEDNASKKRWVLKLDDPKLLAQIDAVFVTIEPNGGSRKPSGKPLLFAYLRVDPNHP